MAYPQAVVDESTGKAERQQWPRATSVVQRHPIHAVSGILRKYNRSRKSPWTSSKPNSFHRTAHPCWMEVRQGNDRQMCHWMQIKKLQFSSVDAVAIAMDSVHNVFDSHLSIGRYTSIHIINIISMWYVTAAVEELLIRWTYRRYAITACYLSADHSAAHFTESLIPGVQGMYRVSLSESCHHVSPFELYWHQTNGAWPDD